MERRPQLWLLRFIGAASVPVGRLHSLLGDDSRMNVYTSCYVLQRTNIQQARATEGCLNSSTVCCLLFVVCCCWLAVHSSCHALHRLDLSH